MIAKHLLKLINNYNENGIYFAYNKNIWWFNGKRLERWLSVVNGEAILSDRSNVYVIDDNAISYVLKDRKFEKNYKSVAELFNLDDVYFCFRICCVNGMLYDFSDGLSFYRNGMRMPLKKHHSYGARLLHYNGFLYFFTLYANGENEKFNLKTLEWSSFSHHRYYLTMQAVYLLNDLFYILFRNGKIGTYNPQTDNWHLLDIKIL